MCGVYHQSTRPEVRPQQLQKVDAGTLKYERHRLETYGTWPMGTPVTAKELAKNGFYYTQTGDRVQCVFCKEVGQLRKVEILLDSTAYCGFFGRSVLIPIASMLDIG
jgi:hypothetical protein